ncbi:hypothetical protein P8452_56324 [Trifolium repens]|nr:hypothetical protein P8452_56324 [Trifolium repens]
MMSLLHRHYFTSIYIFWNPSCYKEHRKEIMEQELIRGREAANQLLEVIVNKFNINPHYHGDLEGLIIPLAQDLVNKVLRSFTNTLFLLSTNYNDVFSDEEVLPITTIKDLSAKCPKLEETDHEACKSFKLQRGCYKRKQGTRLTNLERTKEAITQMIISQIQQSRQITAQGEATSQSASSRPSLSI